MSPAPAAFPGKSRLAVLLEHFGTIDDPRDVRRITHPLAEILLLVVPCKPQGGFTAAPSPTAMAMATLPPRAGRTWLPCAGIRLAKTACRTAAG